MSYKLFTDKINKFQCDLQVEGTSLVKSQARILLETPDMTYLFKGKIYETGVCEFELPKLKGILNEGSIGMVKLEVIADDVHFEPWSSDFIVEANKKVTVTLQESVDSTEKKPNIVMNQITLTETEVKAPAKVVVKEAVKEAVAPKPAPVKKSETIKEEKITDSTVITKNDIMDFVKNRKK